MNRKRAMPGKRKINGTQHVSKVSVVIPVRNMAGQLNECLQSLRSALPAPFEVIVVDDDSQDDSAKVARQNGAYVIELEQRTGANHCRNIGADKVRGSILLFLDADTVPSSTIIGDVVKALSDNTHHGIVGLYSAHHRHTNLSSQYKNLWIRYSYLKCAHRVDWIFGAVSAIRTKVFRDAGGFDGTLMMQHGGGDLELGKRMSTADLSIALAPELEVEHQKKHTLVSLLHNDFERSRSFVEMALRLGHFSSSLRKGFVNVYPAFLLGTALSWPLVFVGILVARLDLPLLAFVMMLAVYISSCGSFLYYFARIRSWTSLLPGAGIMFLDHLTCSLGVIRGLLGSLLKTQK